MSRPENTGVVRWAKVNVITPNKSKYVCVSRKYSWMLLYQTCMWWNCMKCPIATRWLHLYVLHGVDSHCQLWHKKCSRIGKCNHPQRVLQHTNVSEWQQNQSCFHLQYSELKWHMSLGPIIILMIVSQVQSTWPGWINLSNKNFRITSTCVCVLCAIRTRQVFFFTL